MNAATSSPVIETRVGNQWWRAARFFSTILLKNLVMGTAVMVALVLIAQLLASVFNWSLVINISGFPGLGTGDDGAPTGLWIWLAIVVAVAVSAVVLMVVFAATRTRPLIHAGLTRRSISIGVLLAALVGLIYTSLLGVVVLLLIGWAQVLDMFGWAGASPSEFLLGAAFGVLNGMLVGVTIVALFQRWPWWVGTVLLLLIVGVLPVVLNRLDFSALEQFGLFWEALRVVVLGAAYWLLMRRLPVP